MKIKALILILIIISFLNCKKSESKKNDAAEIKNITNQEIEYNNYIYKINKISLGIDSRLKEDLGVDKETFKCSITVRNKGSLKIIQEIKLEDDSDLLVSIDLDNKIFNNLIKVVFQWDKFTTSPYGYIGNKFYHISEKDGRLNLVFSYFERAGAQDLPNLEMNELNKQENQLKLNYNYYEMFGGEGKINVIFNIDKEKKQITFDKIECNILQKERMIDGRYASDDPKYKIEPPLQINFSRDELEQKLNYILKNYKLIY